MHMAKNEQVNEIFNIVGGTRHGVVWHKFQPLKDHEVQELKTLITEALKDKSVRHDAGQKVPLQSAADRIAEYEAMPLRLERKHTTVRETGEPATFSNPGRPRQLSRMQRKLYRGLKY